MSSSKVIEYTNFKASELTFWRPKPRKDSNAKASAYVSLKNHRGKFFVKLPALSTPFGAGDYQDNKKFGVSLNMDEKMDAFVAELAKVEEMVAAFCVEQKLLPKSKKEWTVESASECVYPIVKEPKSDEYSPVLPVKLIGDYGKNTFATKFYSHSGDGKNTEVKDMTTDNVGDRIGKLQEDAYLKVLQNILSLFQ